MSFEYVALLDEEQVLDKPGVLLFRQITFHKWDDLKRQPSSRAFGPESADKGKPSFTQSSVVTAQASRDWHNENAKQLSLSVWACSVGEVADAATRSVDDSQTPSPPSPTLRAPGHAYVDYRHCEKPKRVATRQRLLMAAIRRDVIPTNPLSSAA